MDANPYFLIVAVIALGLGLFIYRQPQKAFDIQKQFYRMINWNIEPISLEKELRNTRWMGLFLIAFVIVACLYVWMR